MRLARAARVLFIAAVYFWLAVISLSLSFNFSNATPVWPASGFAFAILLLWKPTIAPGIFLGAFSANVYVFLNNQTCPVFTAVWVSLLIGIGNMVEAVVGYYLLKRLIRLHGTEKLFDNVASTYWFFAASVLMCLASSTMGATATLLGKIIHLDDYFRVWFTWWTGDVSGILLLTPFILFWFSKKWRLPGPGNVKKIVEGIFVMSVVVLLSGVVFLNWFYPKIVFNGAFVVVPFLIWAAIRLGPQIATALILVSTAIAILGTLEGMGPFVTSAINESLLTLEAFVSINTVTVLLLQSAIIERREKEISLRAARTNLEQLVLERTAELEEKNKQLENRNKELTFFGFAVSHDLREPLRKIDFFCNKILKAEGPLSEERKDLFKRIENANASMGRLIENLLAYSLAGTTKKLVEETDLNEVLEEVKNDLSVSIQETGAVIESTGLPTLRVVSFQIRQLFTNILRNSIKFSRPGVQPHIRVRSRLVSGSVLSDTPPISKKQYCHLAFTDNGIGFDQQYAEELFLILRKLHGNREYEGTGIGLAICKQIVENHNGYIKASGQQGKGCTIDVYLPADEL